MLRPSSPRSILSLALLLLVLSPAAAAERGGLRLIFMPAPYQATESAEWRVPIKVINDLDDGLFGDSLWCETEDLDPGITGAGRRTRGSSNAISTVMKSLGEHDSTVVTFAGIANCEHARLTFHLFAHTASGEVHEGSGRCETAPSLIARSFHSSFLVDKGRQIETVLVPDRLPQGTSPGLLLVHPEGSHARRMLPLAWTLANAGYSVMLVSLPGYGQSTGPADFGGPASVRAVARAFDALRRAPQVDSNRVAIWAFSRGATAAALLATQRRDLTAIVLQSGIYDPASAYRATRSDSIRRALDTQAKSDGGWSRRSALRAADRWRAPVLFIHGDRDSEAVADQAMDLAGRLRAKGNDVKTELMPGAGHALPLTDTYPLVTSFLKPILKPRR